MKSVVQMFCRRYESQHQEMHPAGIHQLLQGAL